MNGDQVNQGGYQSLDLAAAERVEKACLEFEAAWKRAEAPLIENYLYPGDPGERAELLRELLLLELDYQLRGGKMPSVADYLSRFPDDSQVVSDLFDSLANDDKVTQPPRAPHELRAASIEVPCQFGDYELVELLGEGGMGSVYRAVQKSIRRTVAIKVIRPDRLTAAAADLQADIRARFAAEVHAAARLEHPHIVPIYEFGEVQGLPYFSMRYIHGQTVDQLLTEGPLQARAAAALLAKVAAAVEYAHQQGVLHRDLKPRNILLDEDGSPFVADFGLARLLDDDSLLTHTGELLGTPSYMSPEQASGQSPIGPQADVYSLGATFYELLTGRAPFRAAGNYETIRQVLHEQPVSPRRLNSAVDRDAETIVLKCLEKDSDSRYGSAGELQEELSRYVEGRTIRARPHSHVTRAWRWCRRNQVLAVLSAAATVLLITLAIGGPVASVRLNQLLSLSEKNEKLAEEETRKAKLQRDRAEAAEAVAIAQAAAERRRTYIADMKRVEHFCEINDLAVARDILRRYLPAPGQKDLRAFEWYYWWRLSHRERRTFTFEQPVDRVSLHPDGKQLPVAERGGKISVVDIDSGDAQQTFQLENDDCVALQYSADGELLAAAGGQGMVSLWNASTGQRIHHGGYPRVQSYLHAVGFDRSCRYYAWTFMETVGLRDRQRQKSSWAMPTGIGGIVRHGDGRSSTVGYPSASMAQKLMQQMNAIGIDGSPESIQKLSRAQREAAMATALKLSNAVKPSLPVSEDPEDAHAQGGPLYAVALSPDAAHVAVAGTGGAIKVFDAVSGERLHELTAEAEDVRGVVFSDDAKRLAACGTGGFVGLWDLEAEKLTTHFVGHSDTVNAIKLFSGVARLATGGADKTVRIWDVHSGDCIAVLKGHSGSVTSVVVSQDNRAIATSSDDHTVKLWNVPDADAQILSQQTNTTTLGCKFSPKGDCLAWLSRDSSHVDTIEMWDWKQRVPTGSERLSMRGYAGTPDAISFAPDESSLDTSSTRFKLHRDRSTARQPPLFQGGFGGHGRLRPEYSAQPIGPGTYIPSSDKMVFAGLTDGRILMEDGKPLDTSARHCLFVAVSPDGKTLAAAADQGVQFWDLPNGTHRQTLDGHGDYVRCLAFSKDGRWLASASSDSTAKLWDVETGQLLRTLRGHDGGVSWVAFTPDGVTVATAGHDATIRLWDRATGEEKTILRGHQAWVTSLDFSPDGRVLASTSQDGAVRLWDAAPADAK